MITKKSVKIPIYNYYLSVIIFDTWEDLKGHVPDSIYNDNPCKGFTQYGCPTIVAIRSNEESTITHESLHIMEDIWRYIGYDSNEGNNEVGAYLLTYIYEEIKKVWNKHHSTKI